MSLKSLMSVGPLVAFAVFFVAYLSDVPEPLIILAAMVLLAEPHFAAGWPYMLDRRYRDLISSNKQDYVLIPLIIVLLAVIIFTFDYIVFTYAFLLANVYHVNRQSLGIIKLNRFRPLGDDQSVAMGLDIHLPAALFFLIHVFRPLDFSLGVGALVALIIAWIYLLYRTSTLTGTPIGQMSSSQHSAVLQACLIFWPLSFTSNPILALAIGVSIHYVQYLVLTGTIFLKERGRRLGSIFVLLSFIGCYVAITASSQISSKAEGSDIVSMLVLVAAVPQLLHFYLDGLFWRFQKPAVRDRIGFLAKELN